MPPAPNPYGDRKPATLPSQFCVRHNELSFLAEKIRYGHTCAISGEPLMGKTSLLHYIVHPQGARTLPDFVHILEDAHAYLFVLIELGRLPTRNAQGMSRYLYDRLIEEMENNNLLDRKHQHLQMNNDDYEIRRVFEACLKETKKRVVLLFDDFDIVVREFTKNDAEKAMQHLQATIQAFDLNNSLNCVFFSVDPFEQLLQSTGFTIDSPLSRVISHYKPLQPLSREEVDQYIQKPLQSIQVQFPEPEIDHIKRLAGNHPGILKIVCFHMFETRFRKKQPSALHTIQETIEKDPGMHWLLATLWWRIEQAEKQEELPLKNAMIRLAQGNMRRVGEDQMLLERLQRRGLVDSSATDPWILGNIFRKFIQYTDAKANSSPFQNDAHYHKTQYSMTPQESKLYNYLAEHSERTCTRTELEHTIWGDKLPSSRDALEQLVRRIRDKIESHPTSPERLLTIRGLGYLLRNSEKN